MKNKFYLSNFNIKALQFFNIKAYLHNNLENLESYLSKQKSHRQKQQRLSDVKQKRQTIKLSTILQTGALEHKFPKIKPKNKEKDKKPKEAYFKRQKKSRVLTIDTRLSTDQQLSILSSDFKLDIKQLGKPQSQSFSLFDNLSEYGNQPPSLRYLSRPNTNTIDRESLDFSRDQKQFSKSFAAQNQIEEEQTTSDEEEQYIKDANPGPGSYSIQNYSDLVKRTLNRSQRLSFCSKASRFMPKKILQEDNELQKRLKQEEQARQKRIKILNKKQKKYVPFNSQSPKKINFEIKDNVPGPFYYNPRFGIEEDLIKKIQRNFKGNFGVYQKRFVSEGKNKQHLGPGAYTIQYHNEDLQKPSHYFQSKIPRF